MAKVLVNESSLTGIANAIRGKNGSTDTYKPSEMAAAITAIESGGGAEPVIEALEVTSNGTYTATDGVDGYSPITVNVPQDGGKILLDGKNAYLGIFSYDFWNKEIENNKFETKDLVANSIIDTNIPNGLFYRCVNLTNIPFSLNFKKDGNGKELHNLFYECNNLTRLPNISIDKIFGSNSMFEGCYIIDEIPNSYCEPEYNWTFNAMFKYMKTLRKIPQALLDKMNSNVFYANFIYNTFSRLYSIDEINGIFVNSGTLTTNRHNNMCDFCLRVKNITFRTNNGVPIVANWKNQIIDLTYCEGYAISTSGTNSCIYGDITADKLVTDDATYQALKDDPDWWTADIAYSRYNHDSAVATINSLPDTSAYLAANGGNNTIKFEGASGSATDGGAINTLTEEEIAVATAKGWTVTLV